MEIKRTMIWQHCGEICGLSQFYEHCYRDLFHIHIVFSFFVIKKLKRLRLFVEFRLKFKGRSSTKQYMPMKPVKRGIKLLLRCDSISGYCYDMNIYIGRERESVIGTLGERVVAELCTTIKRKDVVLCFDNLYKNQEKHRIFLKIFQSTVVNFYIIRTI